jgi:hypothetical protein
MKRYYFIAFTVTRKDDIKASGHIVYQAENGSPVTNKYFLREVEEKLLEFRPELKGAYFSFTCINELQP